MSRCTVYPQPRLLQARAGGHSGAGAGWAPLAQLRMVGTRAQAPSHDPRARTQRVLDMYDIVDRLHSRGAVAGGGHASVFVAEDRTTGQLVAVKRQQTPSDTVAREYRFFRSLGQHEHPNVMRLLDSFVWPFGSDMCFVFEHMGASHYFLY